MWHSGKQTSLIAYKGRPYLPAVAISFSRGSFWPRDWTQVFYIAGRFFTIWATREAPRKFAKMQIPEL